MSSKYDPDVDSKLIRMGYWISEKKSRRLNIQEFTTFCRNAGIRLVKLDLDEDVESQGPFDIIFHKLTDIMAKAKNGNEHAKIQMQRFQSYTSHHPEVAIVDPLENLVKLMDRHYTYQFVTECEVVEKEYQYFMPNFVEFNSTDVETNKLLMEQNAVQFPFICKPTVAHGSSQCHLMAIIFNENGLKDVEPPCVAQTFINHNAVLYKIFIIGKKHFVVPRPSLKNFSAGNHKTIHFDSASVSKPHSCSFLNVLDDGDMSSTGPVAPDMARLEHLARGLQEKLGLDLIGVDVIIENNTGRYAVVDINAFPGYENGIDHLYDRLLNVFQEKLEIHRKRMSPESSRNTSITSVPSNVPHSQILDTENSEKLQHNKTIISDDMSSDADVARLKKELHDLDINMDDNCNVNDKRNSKEKDQLLLCNNRNCPLSTTSPSAVDDSHIWDEMLSKEKEHCDKSDCPCHPNTWTVN